jgi:hypothetical protein
MKKELSLGPRIIDFTEQPRPSDFSYQYILVPGTHTDYFEEAIFQPAFHEVQERYGIHMKPLSWGYMPPTDRVPYVLLGPVNPLAMNAEDVTYVSGLGRFPQARVNRVTVFPYPENEDYKRHAATDIPAQDRQFGINTIFPDAIDPDHGIRTVTARDVADNIVCETVRLKYRAVRDVSQDAESTVKDAQQKHTEDITDAQRIFREYGLWHRSPTDGMLAFRTDQGYLISQTKTDKSSMTPDDFSLVTSMSPATNEVTYTGKKVPSSDVEFFGALDALPYSMAIHFHHNATTRNPRFSAHVSENVIEYGRFESSELILKEVERTGSNSLLLKEHGWVWFGESINMFESFVTNDLGIQKTNGN